MKLVFIVVPFSYQKNEKGHKVLKAEPSIACKTKDDALYRVGRLAERKAGVIAVSQEYDEGCDFIGKVTEVARRGTVPDGIFEN